MKVIQLDSAPYNQDVWVVIGNSASDAIKYINEKFKDNIDKLDNDGERCMGFQWKTHYPSGIYEKARFFVFINLEASKKSTVIEHELIHLTWDILSHVGVRLSPSNHEAQTYLFDHLLKQLKLKLHGRVNNRRTQKSKKSNQRKS